LQSFNGFRRGEEWKMPATIDGPAILDEITGVMQERGVAKG
jgi:hypothetical protein